MFIVTDIGNLRILAKFLHIISHEYVRYKRNMFIAILYP